MRISGYAPGYNTSEFLRICAQNFYHPPHQNFLDPPLVFELYNNLLYQLGGPKVRILAVLVYFAITFFGKINQNYRGFF